MISWLLVAALLLPTFAVAVVPTVARGQEPAQPAVQTYAVGAGPLRQALQELAHQSGIQLDIAPGLLGGRASAGLAGRYTTAQALDALLAGQGLLARRESPTRYRITLAPGATAGANAPAPGAPVAQLQRIMVYGTVLNPLDVGYTLNVASIDRTKNADLAAALKQVPTVRLDPTANNSMRQGDLLPTEFSISGAPAYQNKIEIAGMATGNLMDPGNHSSQMRVSQLNGNSQGIFIDTTFLSHLRVLDSNISAAEGGFTGGVVKSELRGYRGKTEAGASWRTSRAAWTTFHVDPTQAKQFAAANGNPIASDTNAPYQPSFRKDFYRLHGAMRWGDVGVFAGFSRRRSTIWQRQFSPPVVTVQEGQIVWTYPDLSPLRPIDRQSDFAALKLSLLDRDYLLNLSLTYSGYTAQGFIPYQQQSDFHTDHDGLGVTLDYAGDVGPFHAKGRLSVQDNRDARSDTAATFHSYSRSYWNGDAIWGSYGNLATTQRRTQGSGSLTHSWDSAGGARTTLEFGLDFSALDFRRKRPQEVNIYYENCIDQNQYQCPINAQYVVEHNLYPAGTMRFHSLDAAGYVQLSWQGKHWSHRLGLRYSRDGWLGNVNLAPRWLSAYDIGGDGYSVIQFGANRYYGKSFLAYRLRALDRAGATHASRLLPGDAFVTVPMDSRWLDAKNLATPYADELALNFRQRVLGQYLTLGYLERFGRKQVMTDYLAASDQYRYNNRGRSRTRLVTLAAQPIHPFPWLGASWTYNLSASWERHRSNQQATAGTGLTPYDDVTPSGKLILDGKVIAWADMPTSDYALPRTVSLVTLTHWKGVGLTWRNDLYWRSGYQALVSDGVVTDPASGQRLPAYHRHGYRAGFNWDTGLKYAFDAGVLGGFSIDVDVLNVLDKEIVLRADGDIPLYQAGRQYWLELGWNF